MPVPSCAIWNLLDNELEVDIPLMTVVTTRVLLQARMMDRACQIMYNEIWKLQMQLHSEKGKLEVMIHTCDNARRS